MRAIYEGLGLGRDLAFFELNPDGYDHVLVAGEQFDIPKGKEAFAERLKARFPRERAGIDAYLDTVDRLSRELGDLFEIRGLRDLLALPFRAPTVARWGLRSAGALIDAHARDPHLRAILAAQSGDHGLPPSLASAPVHAAVAAHYFDGGYYPKGGGFTIPRAFMRALKRAGGEVRLRTPVDRILVEDGRAVGVRLGDGTEVRARVVVSNADPDVTFRRLVGAEHLSARLRRRLGRTRYSVSALSLFLAADIDAAALGLDSGNYWYYRHADVEGIYRLGLTAESIAVRDIPGLFLTVTTLKDPTKRRGGPHTMEAFTFVSYEAFRAWAQTRYGDRPEGYRALKADLMERMLDAAARVVPGLRERVVFCDLGTPLTNVHYVAATQGNLYGTEKSRFQVGPWAYPTRTEIAGLHLCGASTLGHGVMGATLSGLAVAKQVLRCRTHELLRARGPELVIHPPEPAARDEAPPRRTPATPTEEIHAGA